MVQGFWHIAAKNGELCGTLNDCQLCGKKDQWIFIVWQIVQSYP